MFNPRLAALLKSLVPRGLYNRLDPFEASIEGFVRGIAAEIEPGNHVLLLGDLSDTTYALTRWIASDPEARAFIAGKPDQWGMRINQKYKNVELPFSTFPLLDKWQSDNYEPIQGMDHLSRQLSLAQFPGAIVSCPTSRNREFSPWHSPFMNCAEPSPPSLTVCVSGRSTDQIEIGVENPTGA